MVLKSPVKISTAVLGHKEKSLSVIGFLAGRIQKLFISFSKREKKKKTCNYCILTPRQAITLQKLSPGNQTLAWLIRLTSLTNPLLEIRAWTPEAASGRGSCQSLGTWRHCTGAGLCFLLLSFMYSLKLNPFPRDRLSSRRRARTNWSPLLHEEEAGKKKTEKKATKVVNSFPHRKSFFAL